MSSQEPTYPVSLLRRTQLWITSQVLVQTIKNAVGFRTEGSAELERLQRERDVYKAQAEALTVEKSTLLSKAEHDASQKQNEHDEQINALQASQLGQTNDLKGRIEATKRDAEEAEARSKSKLDDLTGRLTSAIEEQRLLRDQLQKGEQANRDRTKDLEAHSKDIGTQLDAARKRPNELEASIETREAALRTEISHKSKEVSGLQRQLELLVALVRTTLRSLKASHNNSEDEDLESIIRAIENGLPVGSRPTPGQPSDHSVREEYGSLVEKTDDAYRRLVPGSKRPPKPIAKEGAPVDDYEDRLFRTSSPAETAPPAETADTIPDKEPSEPMEIAAVVNYKKWKRELYTKSPLNQSSIRLVDILPGLPDDKVEITMGVHILDQVAMHFEGLSYVCGNPGPAKEIFIKTLSESEKPEKVPVNPNLYDALISLRQPKSVRRVWIDAICINQMSMNEKSKEVQKMGPIYARAKTAIVFLGAPSSSGPGSPISAFLKFLNRDLEEQAVDRYGDEGLRVLQKACEKCQTDVNDVCKGFVQFCIQPWWSRVWTLQEFYLAREDPIFHWGSEHASNASFKRKFRLLMNALRDRFTGKAINIRVLLDDGSQGRKRVGSFRVESKRILALISRRYTTDGPDIPRRLYRELSARVVNPRDFVYALRAIFNPIFAKAFVPDYQMSAELLFACLTVFLIQFEDWGDVLWWYPIRYAGRKDLPSWLPDFTQRNVPHELDVQPLDQNVFEKPEAKLVVHSHRLHAEGYDLDKVYSHIHIHKSDGQQILEGLWQFDHCMNHNHECHDYLIDAAASEDVWAGVLLEMYADYYARMTYFNSSFRGQLVQSTIKPVDSDKLPQRVAECLPCWDILRWHALKITTPGLLKALRLDVDDAGPAYLMDVFSVRMELVFRKAFADFFIGACIFDYNHLSIWLYGFPGATPWSAGNHGYCSEIADSQLGDMKKRVTAIVNAYSVYEFEIQDEVMRVSWCYSFYYTFLAYVILLDCDDHAALLTIIQKLQRAGGHLRRIHTSITTTQIEELASEVSSVAARLSLYDTVVDLSRGRYLFWTHGGFRGISCPGVEIRCDYEPDTDEKTIVAIVDGLSFPVIVRDYDEDKSEGSLVGCVLIRGVDMLNRDSERAVLPPDYERGEKRIFKFR